MENKLNVSINIDGTSISHFSSFSLEQKFNEHHHFELRFDHDLVESKGGASLTNSKKFIGKNITVEFGVKAGSEQVFSGKVTRVEFSQTHGYNGDLIISGFSPTILLERGPDLGSYLAKSLQSIVHQVTSDIASNDLKIKLNPARTAAIDYIMQYRESDYDFINRLSAEYHEWFFYDGANLNFGKPNKLKDIALVYGRNLQSLQYSLQTTPLKYKKFAYDPAKDQLLTSDGKGTPTGSSDLSHTISATNQLYSKVHNQPTPIRVDSQSDLDQHVENEQKALISELLRVSGNGDEPQLALGTVADISMSVRQDDSFSTQDFGKFLITSIFHHIDGVGHYYNTFEGVASDTERLPVFHYRKPSPDIQIATVTDNDDPDKKSRIKVKLKWETPNNDPTEWLRIVTPSAGSDDQGGNNRGFVSIPEKNDQVLVGFEEGNIARPVILGSLYHSNNGDSNKQQDNHIKSMSTRSGHLIQFDDSSDTQGIIITDRNGNVINIDTKGNNITITAVETLTLKAKNLKINADEKIEVKGADISIEGSNTLEAKGESSAKLEGAQVEITGSSSAKVSGAQLDLEGQSMANLKAPQVNIN